MNNGTLAIATKRDADHRTPSIRRNIRGDYRGHEGIIVN